VDAGDSERRVGISRVARRNGKASGACGGDRKTELRYQLRAIEDLHAMLKAHGGRMPPGGADEQSGPGLVWIEEGTAGPIRDVCASGPEGIATGGSGRETAQ
jgi:hypothetical protein